MFYFTPQKIFLYRESLRLSFETKFLRKVLPWILLRIQKFYAPVNIPGMINFWGRHHPGARKSHPLWCTSTTGLGVSCIEKKFPSPERFSTNFQQCWILFNSGARMENNSQILFKLIFLFLTGKTLIFHSIIIQHPNFFCFLFFPFSYRCSYFLTFLYL